MSDTNLQPSVDIGNNGQAVATWQHHDAVLNRASVQAVLVRWERHGAVLKRVYGALSHFERGDRSARDDRRIGQCRDHLGRPERRRRLQQRLQARSLAGTTTWTVSIADDSAGGAGTTQEVSIESSQSGRLIGGWYGECAEDELFVDEPFVIAFRGTTTAGFTTGQRLSNPDSEDVPLLPTQPSLIGEGYDVLGRMDDQGRGSAAWEVEPGSGVDRLHAAFNMSGGAFGEHAAGDDREGGGVLARARLRRRGRGLDARLHRPTRQRTRGADLRCPAHAHGSTFGAGSWTVTAVSPYGVAAGYPSVAVGGPAPGTTIIAWYDHDNARVYLRSSRADQASPLLLVPANHLALKANLAGDVPYLVRCPFGEVSCIGSVSLQKTGSPGPPATASTSSAVPGGSSRSCRCI